MTMSLSLASLMDDTWPPTQIGPEVSVQGVDIYGYVPHCRFQIRKCTLFLV